MKHFYPGMGATSEMYGGPWRDLKDSTFHNWPKSKGETMITELAQRLICENGIRKGDTVIGTSLGGIVACEIANQIELKKLVLIGSAVCQEEINILLRRLHPLIDLTPLSFIRLSAGSLPNELSGMFSESEPEFIRNMSKAIFKWEGLRADVELVRIHGKKDRVIPLVEGKSSSLEGGHLIAMTHSKECIELCGFE